MLDALASDARTRIAHVRDGLRSILRVLSSAPGTVVVVDDYRLEPPPVATKPGKASAPKLRAMAASRSKARVASKPTRAVKPAGKTKRGRANV